MTIHLTNARLIDPEAGTDAPGSVTLKDGLIAAINGVAPQGRHSPRLRRIVRAPGIVDSGVSLAASVSEFAKQMASIDPACMEFAGESVEKGDEVTA